jgi:hypothetical protein
MLWTLKQHRIVKKNRHSAKCGARLQIKLPAFPPTCQSRSPSLRSSERNARLWDNPLPEARNPGYDWTTHSISTANQIPPWNGLSQSLAFLPEDRRLGERDWCWHCCWKPLPQSLVIFELVRENLPVRGLGVDRHRCGFIVSWLVQLWPAGGWLLLY